MHASQGAHAEDTHAGCEIQHRCACCRMRMQKTHAGCRMQTRACVAGRACTQCADTLQDAHTHARTFCSACIHANGCTSVTYAVQGLDVAKAAVISFLEKLKHPVNATDRETLRMVARTSLRTKVRVCWSTPFCTEEQIIIRRHQLGGAVSQAAGVLVPVS
eukprot:scaffold218876_cov31-Tisochrysis_lutea.AAC.1